MRRKHFWRIGLALLTTSLLIWSGRPGWLHSGVIQPPGEVAAVAQTPSPSPTLLPAPSPEVSPTASPAALPSPSPAVSPSPTVPATPTPVASPSPTETPTPSPSPEVSPSPTPTVDPTTVPVPETTVSVKETYVDPGKRFQVGLLEGYTQSVVAGVPIFESANGQVAYSVAVRSRATDSELSDAALAQVAIDTFYKGEGFIPGLYEPTLSGGARIPWKGTVTINRNTEPMQGVMLSRQIPNRLIILMIAATEDGAAEVEQVFSALAPTLTEVQSPGT